MNLELIAAASGYLLGSLPFGWLVARAHGVDIFAVGSRSSGATNVLRTLGPRAGYTVFVLDALKGAAAAGWPILAFHRRELGVIGLAFAMIGHAYSCFTKFRGGKSAATGAGGFLVLMPTVTLIAGGIWIIVFYATRYVSLASILAALATPVAAFAVGESTLLIVVAAVMGAFVIARHRANILRLFQGTENKVARK